MKTVFRKGMKVYDQIYEPDVKGEVLDVNLDISPHPITVKFGSCVRYYTAEGWRGRNQIRTLSTSPYRIEGFEQKAPAPTYEEAVKRLIDNNQYDVSMRHSEVIYFTKKENYDVFEALRKLIILRDYYNKGYNFEWLKNEYYAVVVEKIEDTYEVAVRYIKNSQRLLFFKSREIAEKFLEEQKELLEEAKPLL